MNLFGIRIYFSFETWLWTWGRYEYKKWTHYHFGMIWMVIPHKYIENPRGWYR